MNSATVLFVLCTIALVHCEPPSPGPYAAGAPSQGYGAPSSGYGAPTGGQAGGHGGGNGGFESNEPKPYEFGYKVKDEYTGSNFNQKESSDGNKVRGEYKVELPDGRTQIVTYWADWKSGFHADVRYEGEATYPKTQPKSQYGAPNGGNKGSGGYSYPSPPSPSSSYGAPTH